MSNNAQILNIVINSYYRSTNSIFDHMIVRKRTAGLVLSLKESPMIRRENLKFQILLFAVMTMRPAKNGSKLSLMKL